MLWLSHYVQSLGLQKDEQIYNPVMQYNLMQLTLANRGNISKNTGDGEDIVHANNDLVSVKGTICSKPKKMILSCVH